MTFREGGGGKRVERQNGKGEREETGKMYYCGLNSYMQRTMHVQWQFNTH